MSDKLLSVRIVARQLGLTSKSVYRLIQAGDLDAVRITPRTIRVSCDSLERLLKKRFEESPYEKEYRDSAMPDTGPSDSRRRPVQ